MSSLPLPLFSIDTDHRFADAVKLLGDTVTLHKDGYATDKKYPHIHILPEDMQMDLNSQTASWHWGGGQKSIRILPGHVYLHPSGYKIRLLKHAKAPTFRLIGTGPEGTYCHKPSTVSGGGKSEISKSLNDAVIYGPLYIGDYEKDMDFVQEIIERDYSNCFTPEHAKAQERDPSRPVLSPDRSLGSVINLLAPDEELYTDEHNEYVSKIPNHIRAIVFAIKRLTKPDWNGDWRSHFTVDEVNGAPGHELKVDDRPLVGSFLRVGLDKNTGNWRTYKLRQDFISADKVQMEDVSPPPSSFLAIRSAACLRESTTPTPASSLARIASGDSSSDPTMPFIPAMISRRSGICRARAFLAATSSPSTRRKWKISGMR